MAGFGGVRFLTKIDSMTFRGSKRVFLFFGFLHYINMANKNEGPVRRDEEGGGRRWGKEGGSVGWSRSEGVRGSDKEKYYIIGPKAQEMGRRPTQQPSAGARMKGP